MSSAEWRPFCLAFNVLEQFKSVDQSGYTYQRHGLRGSNIVHTKHFYIHNVYEQI